jgi:type I site-specific restriction endonuclease
MAHSGTEAFSRVMVDALLRDVGWNLTDGRSVRFEYLLPDGTKADYVLSDRFGRAMAVIEAKRTSVDPRHAEGQATGYAKLLKVPFIFLTNGTEVWFWAPAERTLASGHDLLQPRGSRAPHRHARHPRRPAHRPDRHQDRRAGINASRVAA